MDEARTTADIAALLAEALHNEVIGCKWDDVTEYEDCPGASFHAADGRLLARSSVLAPLRAGVRPAARHRVIAAARLQGDPGLLRRSDLEVIEAEASTAHDYVWLEELLVLVGKSPSLLARQRQANEAIWSIHNIVRAALAASPPEPEPLDVERLAKAMYAVWPGHPEGTGGTGGNAEAMLMWRVLDPAIYSDYLVNAIAAEYARLSEPETP